MLIQSQNNRVDSSFVKETEVALTYFVVIEPKIDT